MVPHLQAFSASRR